MLDANARGELVGIRLLGSIEQALHVVSVPRKREGEKERTGMGETRRIEALRGKGRRVMRSRLVHEWRGVVGGWYFVPFQSRRKPRRQDFGVRLKSLPP